jgi:NADH-quinone oxidoreductase subunit M
MSGHLLSVVIFLPLLGVLGLVLGGRQVSDAGARWIALLVTLVVFGVSLAVLGRFVTADAGYQLVEQASWVPGIGLQYLVGVDGISLWLVLLTTFLFPITVLASWTVTTEIRRYMIAMLVLETAVLGSFLALDLILFFIFSRRCWCRYPLDVAGSAASMPRSSSSNVAGSAFLLVAIIFLYAGAGEPRSIGPLTDTAGAASRDGTAVPQGSLRSREGPRIRLYGC